MVGIKVLDQYMSKIPVKGGKYLRENTREVNFHSNRPEPTSSSPLRLNRRRHNNARAPLPFGIDFQITAEKFQSPRDVEQPKSTRIATRVRHRALLQPNAFINHFHHHFLF